MSPAKDHGFSFSQCSFSIVHSFHERNRLSRTNHMHMSMLSSSDKDLMT